MYSILNKIEALTFKGLQVEKLITTDSCETLLISLEKSAVFPTHTAPRDALLVMLEGDIDFSINHATYRITKHQTFSFPANEKHSVHANSNAKFLIVR